MFQILLRFISETGGSKIAQALNHHKSTGQLTVSQRRLVLHAVADYLVKENGYYPTKDCKKELAHVVVSLFPCLSKKQGDNVIVSHFFIYFRALTSFCLAHFVLIVRLEVVAFAQWLTVGVYIGIWFKNIVSIILYCNGSCFFTKVFSKSSCFYCSFVVFM